VSTFALIHGAWHGAWCWSELVPELEARGQRAVALELPSDDNALGFSDYARLVDGAVEGEEDVVVVAHSLMGCAAPLVAAARRIVFLTAILPQVGRSLNQQFEAGEAILRPGSMASVALGEDGRSRFTDQDAAADLLFGDLERGRAVAAVAQLRSQSRTPHAEPFPLAAFPDVPVTSVVCADDRVMNNDWVRRASRERFGVECVELPGGHSPMLSRPGALADLLVAA
jgi:pimeloyl-ACP methyl ester carboxylesterase